MSSTAHAHNVFRLVMALLLISPLIQALKKLMVGSEVFQGAHEVKELVEFKKAIHDASKTIKVSVYCLSYIPLTTETVTPSLVFLAIFFTLPNQIGIHC